MLGSASVRNLLAAILIIGAFTVVLNQRRTVDDVVARLANTQNELSDVYDSYKVRLLPSFMFVFPFRFVLVCASVAFLHLLRKPRLPRVCRTLP